MKPERGDFVEGHLWPGGRKIVGGILLRCDHIDPVDGPVYKIVKLPNELATGAGVTYAVCVDRADGLSMQLVATRLLLPRTKGLRHRRLQHAIDGLRRLCEEAQ